MIPLHTEASHPVIAQTRDWVQRWVVGLDLCPFARAVQGRIGYRVCESPRRDEQLAALGEEMRRLAQMPEAQLATTLLVYPQGLEIFAVFLQRVQQAQDLLSEAGFEGVLQLAHFHPDYLFADEPPEDASHFSNRAPHPTLHLLREASVSHALDRYPQPQRIPARNITRLRAMGIPALRALQAGFPVDKS